MSAIAGRIASTALRGYSHVAPTERGAYRLVRFGRRFIPRHRWHDRFVTPQRISLDLDIATYPDCMMAFGLYELDSVRVLRRILIHGGGWFVDCGANIGYFSLLAARWCHRVDAFEPDPPNRERLKANVRANEASAVTIHDVAVSDRAGTFTLYHPTGGDEQANHGMAGAFASTLSRDAQRFDVRCVRLDEHLRDPSGRVPDVIKIDVEGGELAAIRGMSGWLGAPKPPVIIVEHNPATAAAAGFLPGEMYDTLMSVRADLEIFFIGRRLRRIGSAAKLNQIARQGNLLVVQKGRRGVV
jgi:FkbM family methyltransferase